MLVVVLTTVGAAGMLLVLLVAVSVMLVVLVVLEGLAQVHLHEALLVPRAAVHHDIVALVRVALVEHPVLLRRLRPWGSRRGGCVGIEGSSVIRGWRAHPGGKVAVEVLGVVRIEGLAGSPLVSRIVGHQRVSRGELLPLPGAAVVEGSEGAGLIRGSKLGRRRGRTTRFSSSEHGHAYNRYSSALKTYGLLRVGMYQDAGVVVWAASRAGSCRERA